MLNSFKKATTWLWNKTIEVSPYPPIRSVEVAFVRIYRKINHQKMLVGSFIPELYLLANTENGSLRCQIEKQTWIKKRQQKNLPHTKYHLRRFHPQLYQKLYHNDGTPKTPFELAIVPCHKLINIEKEVAQEFKYRGQSFVSLTTLGFPLPHPA